MNIYTSIPAGRTIGVGSQQVFEIWSKLHATNPRTQAEQKLYETACETLAYDICVVIAMKQPYKPA
jgi:hypothetical protein